MARLQRVTNHANGRSVVVTTLTPLHPLETSRSESEDSSTLTFEGECSGYEDGDEVTIEAQGRWYGIEICVRATPLLNMQVSAGADL